MYDARVESTTIVPNQYPTWDLYVENGSVPIVDGSNEESQRASIAVFLQTGTILSLPDISVDWTAFFMKNLTFGDLDTAVRKALQDSESFDFEPYYDIVGEDFYTSIRRVQT